MIFSRGYINFFFNILLIVTAVTSLISPAVINGYPLVYSDSGTYIYAGHSAAVPVDRPLSYCLFVRHISMSYTLWFVVISQALIMFSLIWILFKNVVQAGEYAVIYAAASCVILSFTTSLSNYTSQIMPDIFSAAAILSLGILVSAKHLSFVPKIYLGILIILSCLFHTSNLLSVTLLFILFFIITWLFNRFNTTFLKIFRIRAVALIVALAWIIYPSVNYVYGAGFSFSRTANVFHIYNFLETGVMKTYLEDVCAAGNMPICKYSESLSDKPWEFLWDQANSPLYEGTCLQRGWGECWLEKNDEYKPIVHDIVTTPKYLYTVISSCVGETIDQLLTYNIGHLIPMMESSPVLGGIRKFFSRDYQQYVSSGQAKGTLRFETINSIQNIALPVSMALIFISAIIFHAHLKNIFFPFILIIFLGQVSNAAACSFFANMVDRYQSRIIWLIPLAALALSVSLARNKFSKISNSQPPE